MKFWKQLRLIGSAIVLVLGVLAFFVALIQAPASSSRPMPASPPGTSDTQQHVTQGL